MNLHRRTRILINLTLTISVVLAVSTIATIIWVIVQ